MTFGTQMFQDMYPGNLCLLQCLTVLLLLACTDTQAADLPKAVVNLEPPWIRVLQEDFVTLKCHGAHFPGNSSTQWFHSGSHIPTQVQPSYSFKATVNDSGQYRCQTGQTQLSDPVQLDVFTDVVLLQTTQLVFQEGEPIFLRCHSRINYHLQRIQFFHNGKDIQFSYKNDNYSISQANRTHSGEYSCRGMIRSYDQSSQPVTITVQGSTIPFISSFTVSWYQITFFLVMALLFTVDMGLYVSLQRGLRSSTGNVKNSNVNWINGLQDK